MADPENINHVRNTSRFLIYSRVQEPTIKEFCIALNSSNITIPVSVITTKLYFHSWFYQPGKGYSRGKKEMTRKNTENTGNNRATDITSIRKKKKYKNDKKRVIPSAWSTRGNMGTAGECWTIGDPRNGNHVAFPTGKTGPIVLGREW